MSKPSQQRTPPGAHERDAKRELLNLAVVHLACDDASYERTRDHRERYREVIHEVTVYDPWWLVTFTAWLRNKAHLRGASIVTAAEMARAWQLIERSEPSRGSCRSPVRVAVNLALKRLDEPGELLGYWLSRYGKPIPKPLKRGLADALQRLGGEFSGQYGLVRCDANEVRLGDVIELVRPKPLHPAQSALFKYAIDLRHGRDNLDLTLLERDDAHWPWDGVPQATLSSDTTEGSIT